MENNNNRQDATAALFGFPATSRSKLEQTLCLIKPEAMDQVGEIKDILQREGFTILQARKIQLEREQAAEFYQDLSDSQAYAETVAHLCSDEIMALLLSSPGAIQHLNEIIGPETYKHRQQYPGCLRHRFGVKNNDIQNGLHGSASESDAMKELYFFFPELTVEPSLADWMMSYYSNESVHPLLTVALSELLAEKPDNPLIWLADWLTANNPNKGLKQKNTPT